ncbi:MAG: ABC transporter ATP-binding protein [Candidatus Delongbacteria bacterium]|jgi:ABC-2 type transport system ATP-binding protein|nr:ABC transporter ATP-binding protein [Candidatus Delongbacteria bacterium]
MTKVITVDNLVKKYKEFYALDDISFSVNKGEILGFLGPNGAGKTTTIKSILSLLEYEEGKITVNGFDAKRERKKILLDIGAVLEGARNIYWHLSPDENINYFAGIMGLSPKKIKEEKEYLLKKLKLWDVKDKQVREFSKGMQQKTAIAASIIHKPTILLLDEPTLGLDVETKNDIREWIISMSRDENKTILITSHDMSFIESICERILIIKKGKLLSNNSMSELKEEFANKKYTITIEGNFSDADKENFKEIGEYKITGDDLSSTLEVSLKNSKEIYNIFDILKLQNKEILDINISERTLEDIFTELTTDEVK